MSKIELPNVTGGYNLSAINNNFQKIEDTLNKEVLYRKGYVGEPNEMQTNLDMNGNRILNISIGSSPNDLATRGYVDQEISEAVAYTDQQISEERDYVDQNLAPINADLANKYDKAGGPMSGDILMNGHSIYGVDLITSSKVSTTTLEVGGVQVVPTNLAIDPYNGTREALRRSYAEAGYNLVDGSFEAGGTLVNANDVLLQERTGKAFSGPAGTVAAGTNPAGGGFVDKSGVATSASAISNANGGSVQDFIDESSNVEERLLGVGAKIYRGSNGQYVQNGDTVPAGTTHLRVLINGSGENLVAWGELTLPATIIATPTMDNGFSGYNIVTEQGNFEFVTEEVYRLRVGGLPTAKPEPFVEGWGAKSGTDSTAAFKKAIEFARMFNTTIQSRDGDFHISERLFFGPLTEGDLNTPDGYPTNVCLGYIGQNIKNTKLIPTTSLSGDVVIDMTGLRDKFLKNFEIDVDSAADCPAVGILTARFYRPTAAIVSNNDWGEFCDIRVGKYFSVAPYLAAATEEIDCNRCSFRTDHVNAIAPFVSTLNLLATWPSATEASETSLSFTTGNQSNLHQTHSNCEYYFGTSAPTDPRAAMVYIYGSYMVNILQPFFNNNATNIDAVVVEKDPGQAFVYGIHVSMANFHQTVKSGMRLRAANTSCSLTLSNRTTAFEEGALIVEAFTNGFFSNFLDGDLVIKGNLANCHIQSCNNMTWEEKYAIEGSFIGVRGAITTDDTDRVATNDFRIENNGKFTRCLGFWGVQQDSAFDVQVGLAGKPGLTVGTDYGSYNNDLILTESRATTSGDFNYLNCKRNGVQEIQLRRGGNLYLRVQGAGLWMHDTSGKLRRLVFNSDGSVSASLT